MGTDKIAELVARFARERSQSALALVGRREQCVDAVELLQAPPAFAGSRIDLLYLAAEHHPVGTVVVA